MALAGHRALENRNGRERRGRRRRFSRGLPRARTGGAARGRGRGRGVKVEEAGLEMPAVVMRRWSMPRRLRFKRDSTPTPLSLGLSVSLCVSRSLGLSALSLSALSLSLWPRIPRGGGPVCPSLSARSVCSQSVHTRRVRRKERLPGMLWWTGTAEQQRRDDEKVGGQHILHLPLPLVRSSTAYGG